MLKLSRGKPQTYKVSLISPSGDAADLTAADSVMRLDDGGIQGLVGVVQQKTVTGVGLPGQLSTGLNVEPMVGSLAMIVKDYTVLSRLRGMMSTRFDSTLAVESPKFGRFAALVRLAAPIAAPAADPVGDEWIPVTLDLIANDGLWWSATIVSPTGEKNVTVTNSGDVPAHPKIRWGGAGGEVTLPSGATFTLPQVTAPRSISFDPLEMLAVRDDKGELDRETWLKLRGKALPESVPAGESRKFMIPSGASISWHVGVFDPWR